VIIHLINYVEDTFNTNTPIIEENYLTSLSVNSNNADQEKTAELKYEKALEQLMIRTMKINLANLKMYENATARSDNSSHSVSTNEYEINSNASARSDNSSHSVSTNDYEMNSK